MRRISISPPLTREVFTHDSQGAIFSQLARNKQSEMSKVVGTLLGKTLIAWDCSDSALILLLEGGSNLHVAAMKSGEITWKSETTTITSQAEATPSVDPIVIQIPEAKSWIFDRALLMRRRIGHKVAAVTVGAASIQIAFDRMPALLLCPCLTREDAIPFLLWCELE